MFSCIVMFVFKIISSFTRDVDLSIKTNGSPPHHNAVKPENPTSLVVPNSQTPPTQKSYGINQTGTHVKVSTQVEQGRSQDFRDTEVMSSSLPTPLQKNKVCVFSDCIYSMNCSFILSILPEQFWCLNVEFFLYSFFCCPKSSQIYIYIESVISL